LLSPKRSEYCYDQSLIEDGAKGRRYLIVLDEGGMLVATAIHWGEFDGYWFHQHFPWVFVECSCILD
jgi:hypothetical protein